jgi:hypothetical protein
VRALSRQFVRTRRHRLPRLCGSLPQIRVIEPLRRPSAGKRKLFRQDRFGQ